MHPLTFPPTSGRDAKRYASDQTPECFRPAGHPSYDTKDSRTGRDLNMTELLLASSAPTSSYGIHLGSFRQSTL